MFSQVLHGKVVVIIVVYVDDLLAASATKPDEEQALRDRHSRFPIKDLGEPPHYVGCRITWDRDTGTLRVNHYQYVQAVTERFGIPSAAGGPRDLSRHTSLRLRRDSNN